MIMSGTIRENITFCNHDIGEEEIRKAAEIACIWDYIETLPQGLETVLTERGRRIIGRAGSRLRLPERY